MSRILIAGGAGFIGYHIASALSADPQNEITIIDDLSRGNEDSDLKKLLQRENVEFISADLTDQKTFDALRRDYEYIYHLAAVIGVKNVNKDPDKVLRVNALSMINILEYAKGLKGLPRIVFSSTSEVYAGTLKHFGITIPTDEKVTIAIEDISSSRSTYAVSKIFGESAAFAYSGKYGIPVTIVRYHNVYGPRMGFAHVIPETFVKILSSPNVEVPSLHHTRAFCYVDDAVEATIKAAESSRTEGEILHIGNSREEISVGDLVVRIGAVMGRNITIKGLPETPGSPSRRCPDITKAADLIAFSPKISLAEGLARSYAWYKDKIEAVKEVEKDEARKK